MTVTTSAPPTSSSDRWRLATGITLDDRQGVLQAYVAESQRGFAMAGIAAEIFLDLMSYIDAAPNATVTCEQFLDAHGPRYDVTRLEEAWAVAIASGIVVQATQAAMSPSPAFPGVTIKGAADSFADDLLRSELEQLGTIFCDDDDTPTLVVGLDDVGDDAALLEIGRALPWKGSPWLPVQLLQDRVAIGPLVFPGDTACYECALTRRAASLAPDGVRRWGHERVVRPDHVDRRAVAKIASVVVRDQAASLMRREPPSLTSRRMTFDLRTCTQLTSLVLEVPGCTTCRLTDGMLR